jgi:hypothetical protein
MFPEHNICAGTFGLRMKLYTIWIAKAEPMLKLCTRELRLSSRKRNRLREEKAI